MGWGNAYYEVVEPFRVFVATGSSPSNTYFGNARHCELRLEARNARPGSVVHALVGGLFLVDPEGVAHEIRLLAPKPPLEKSYGPRETDGERCEALAKAGLLREVPKPSPADYKGARDRAMRSLPDLTGGVVTVEASPCLAALQESLGDFADELKGAGYSVTWSDIGEDGAARLRFRTTGMQFHAGVALISTGRAWAHGTVPDDMPRAESFVEAAARGHMRIDDVAGILSGNAPSP